MLHKKSIKFHIPEKPQNTTSIATLAKRSENISQQNEKDAMRRCQPNRRNAHSRENANSMTSLKWTRLHCISRRAILDEIAQTKFPYNNHRMRGLLAIVVMPSFRWTSVVDSVNILFHRGQGARISGRGGIGTHTMYISSSTRCTVEIQEYERGQSRECIIYLWYLTLSHANKSHQ